MIDTEDAIQKAIFHYKSQAKQYGTGYWNDTANALEIALKEVKQYHKLNKMLDKMLFPTFYEEKK